MLTDAPPAEPAKPVVHPSQPSPSGRTLRETLRNMLSRRALVWSGLAVAIAVMMTIAQNSKPKPDAVPRNIAQAPAKASSAAPADAPARRRRGVRQGPGLLREAGLLQGRRRAGRREESGENRRA